MQSIAEPIRAETETRPGTTKSAAYCIPRALEQRGFPPGNNHTGQVHSLLQLRYGTRRLFRGPNSAEKERWDVICTSTAGLAFQFVSFLTALNNSWGKEKSGLSSRWTLAAVIPQLLIFRARRGFADELMRRFRLGNGRGVKMSLCDLFLWLMGTTMETAQQDARQSDSVPNRPFAMSLWTLVRRAICFGSC